MSLKQMEYELPANFNWSFSKLMNYETCAMRIRLKYIDKEKELPPKPDNPMERGNRIHKRLEDFVNGEGGMDTEARSIQQFVPALDHLRDLKKAGCVTTEQDWFFDRDWNVCDRENVWLWVKLDFNAIDEDALICVPGDYKSGKSTYKAIEHVQQVQLYSAVAALKYEHIDTFIPELWYVDEGWVRQAQYTREEALRFVGRFDARAQKMYDDKYFRPNPNKMTCTYCPFGPRNGTGVCPVGV